MEKLYLVIPAYNEQDNIARLVEDWYPVAEAHTDGATCEARLLIVNDGSRDDTGRILDELATTRPLLSVIHKKNGGHGPAIYHGYQMALESGADFIFQTDSDGQTLASEFDTFWQNRHDYDMLIGHRKGRKDGFSRKCVSKVLAAVLHYYFHVRLVDPNTPFRLMKREALAPCLGIISENEPLTNALVSALMVKMGRRVKWLPITFRERQGGKNSINLKRIFRIGRRALHDFAETAKRAETASKS
ncbi:MAG: glycosyltransferase family 2 protein [Lachnospiraceae bacterium]|nr:glycosyltransferase family 2 protein [Lachnospiraceae bacterium]